MPFLLVYYSNLYYLSHRMKMAAEKKYFSYVLNIVHSTETYEKCLEL